MTSTTSYACHVGVAEADLTPQAPAFLFGYPRVPRMSTGVNDPLLASAIWIETAGRACLFIGCDLILLTKAMTTRLRASLAESLGLPTERIMISATHTHSGPVMSRMVSNAADPVVPDPDGAYLADVAAAIESAAHAARGSAEPATLRWATIESVGLGGNRRDPAGPTLPQWPVVYAERSADGTPLAAMSVCAMHPTVLHEDSTLISGDFPGLARQALKSAWGDRAVYLHHMGASGDQSPRHVTRANTMAEARRLGDLLAERLVDAKHTAQMLEPTLNAASVEVDLPMRDLPSVQDAMDRLAQAEARYRSLQAAGGPAARTAETDWFGAEETLTLAKAAAEGRLGDAVSACMPAEVQVIWLGEFCIVGWPGEVFVQYALDLQERAAGSGSSITPHVVTLANGDLQGYVVTEQAVREGFYEAGNAVFDGPESGRLLIDTTLGLLARMDRPGTPT